MTGADRDFALVHVPRRYRKPVAALWALDEALGRIVASTTQPMIGQLRLIWWHDAMLSGQSGEPVLADLAAHVHPLGIDGASLAPLVEGWEVLLDPLPLSAAALEIFARARGETLFSLTARAMGRTIEQGPGGGWALADLAGRCRDLETARTAYTMARGSFSGIVSLPRPLRILARLAALDAATGRRAERSRLRLFRASW